MKSRWYILFFFLANIIYWIELFIQNGMNFDFFQENPFHLIITGILIAFWVCFCIKTISMIKYYREYNSPHNTLTFIFGIIFIGVFYSIWGNFTDFLQINLLAKYNSIIYIGVWNLVFSYIFLLYGGILLYYCYNRYYIVYLGNRSFRARSVARFLSILIIFIELLYSIWLYVIYPRFTFGSSFFPPKNDNMDPLRILFDLYALILLITFRSGGRIPEISPDYVRARLRRVQQTSRNASNIASIPVRSPSPSRSSSNASMSSSSSRSIPSYSQSRSRSVQRKEKKKIDFNKYKPRTGKLTRDDFKCIFCFQLPESPKDDSRGIVICPHCHYPAHADEYLQWTQNSRLCSRCDSPLPDSYRFNPKIISTANYQKIIHKFSKEFKK